MNYSTLEPAGYSRPLKNYEEPEWSGQRSCKFGRTIRFMPKNNLIKTNFDMPDQTPRRGRSHFYQPNSFEKPQRSSIHKVPEIDHWHLRQSKIRTMDFKPTKNPQRREMKHNIWIKPAEPRLESLRTFYNSNCNTEREYGVEDRMQRKVRIDQLELRRSYFKYANPIGKP